MLIQFFKIKINFAKMMKKIDLSNWKGIKYFFKKKNIIYLIMLLPPSIKKTNNYNKWFRCKLYFFKIKINFSKMMKKIDLSKWKGIKYIFKIKYIIYLIMLLFPSISKNK